MSKLYSYVLRYDDGAAPNPFWDVCTLTICKPAIRRKTEIGNWIIGTGSKNVQVTEKSTVNFSDSLVYAMKVSDIKTIEQYDKYCQTNLKSKIPIWKTKDWRLRLGDCIYDFSADIKPSIRKSVHDETNRKRDLSGLFALLSDHFYYFGIEARPIPNNLLPIIKRNQGHRVIENAELIERFETWIGQFNKNKIYAEPQLKWRFEKGNQDEIISKCAKQHFEDDENETEEAIC